MININLLCSLETLIVFVIMTNKRYRLQSIIDFTLQASFADRLIINVVMPQAPSSSLQWSSFFSTSYSPLISDTARVQSTAAVAVTT